MIGITIFTPTYNRANLLLKLYKSLKNQKQNLPFEWIIVDDGSTDDTEKVVASFIRESLIDIKYIKQKNKGKHFAINKGVKLAKGELFWIVDSDDSLPSGAIACVQKRYKQVVDDLSIGGIAGRRMSLKGEIIGRPFDQVILSNSIDIRFQYHITGDLVEVFKTSVMKQFPFPEIEGEKFCPEALIWNRIAQKYKLLFFNKGIYVADYQTDGLTSKIVEIRMKSPMASMLTYSELASSSIPLKEKVKASINFWRFSFNSKKSFDKKLKMMSMFLSVIGLPLGYLMFLNDKKYLN